MKQLLRRSRGALYEARGVPVPGQLVNASELRPQFRAALRHLQQRVGRDRVGDYLEFGMWYGHSLMLMHDELRRAGLDRVRLFGFDSFAGCPPDDEGLWKTGHLAVSYDEAVRSLERQGVDWSRTVVVEGFFRESLTEALVARHNLQRVSTIFIDCVMYSSTKEALDFCAPLVCDEAIVFFDDWNPLARQNKGEKRAFDEFLQEHPEFTASPFGEYSLQPGDRNGKIFSLRRQF